MRPLVIEKCFNSGGEITLPDPHIDTLHATKSPAGKPAQSALLELSIRVITLPHS
jgi:hypothetical protein